MLIVPVSAPILDVSEPIAPPAEPEPIAPPFAVSALIAPPELILDESVLTEVESEEEVELPLPQAAKAPSTNTNNNFFIVSLLLVSVDFKINTSKEE